MSHSQNITSGALPVSPTKRSRLRALDMKDTTAEAHIHTAPEMRNERAEAAECRRRLQSKRQRTGLTMGTAPQEPKRDSRWGDRYYERQQRAECGRHALNNVLGVPMFTDLDMTTAAEQVITETDTH